MNKKVLVAVDGSPESELALIKALEFIKADETDLFAVYVISPSKYATIEGTGGYEGMSTLHEIRDKIISEERETITEQVKKVADKNNLKISMIVRLGDPRSEILKVAEEESADLIVLGSTGKGLGQRILLGSVSTYIVTHARISTIVVR
jgi:nucleotide-binding universal stress UspA family protein